MQSTNLMQSLSNYKVWRLYLVTYLFNLYAEYIMRNTGLKEAQAGIKIALAILGLLLFHVNWKTFCSSSVKNAIGNLIGITLNL